MQDNRELMVKWENNNHLNEYSQQNSIMETEEWGFYKVSLLIAILEDGLAMQALFDIHEDWDYSLEGNTIHITQ